MKKYTFSEAHAGIRIIEESIIKTPDGTITSQELYGKLGVVLTAVDDSLTNIQVINDSLSDSISLVNSFEGSLTAISDTQNELQRISNERATLLTNIQSSVNGLNTSLTAIKSRVSATESSINDLSDYTELNTTEINNHSDLINIINTTLTSLSSSISTINATLDTLASNITLLTTATSANTQGISNLNIFKTNTLSTLSSIQNITNNLTNDLNSLVNTVETLASSLNNTISEVNVIKDNIITLTSSVNNLVNIAEDVSNNTDSINQINSALASITSEVTDNTTDINVLKTVSVENKNDITNIVTDINAISNQIDEVNSSISDVGGSEVETLLKSISRLNQSRVYNDTGTTNTIILDRPWVTGYDDVLFDGLTIDFISNSDYSSTTSLKLGSLQAINVLMHNRSIRPGDIKSGYMYTAIYDESLNKWLLYTSESQDERIYELNNLRDTFNFTGLISYVNGSFYWAEDLLSHTTINPSTSTSLKVTTPNISSRYYYIDNTGKKALTYVNANINGIPLSVGSSLVLRLSPDLTSYELLLTKSSGVPSKLLIGDIVVATAYDDSANGYVKCIGGRSVCHGNKSYPDTEWIPFVFENNWTNYGNNYEEAEYRVINDNVELRGVIKDGSYNNGKVIVTLPSYLKPKKKKLYTPTVKNGSSKARLDITTNGELIVYKLYNNGYVSVNTVYSIN